MDTMPEGSLVPQRGWWSRNWKWFVPVGCLSLLASCGCLGAILLGVGFSSLSKVGAYTEAVAIATSDAQVRRALGSPIDTGLPQQSSLSSSHGRTQARFTIPLDGPEADGLLRVDAEQQEDSAKWRYSTLAVELEDGTLIDLRDDAPSPPGQDAPEEDSEEGLPQPPTPKPPVLPQPPLGAEPPGRDTAEPPAKGDGDIQL